MCGRYAASKDHAELVTEFDVEVDATGEPARSVLAAPQDPPTGSPDWNMAPTKQAPVVLTRPRRGGRTDPDPGAAAAVRQLRLLSWGLVPSWAKDVKAGARMVNARAESVLVKPAFARAFARRRCLVPAAGWYEWQVSPTVTERSGRPRRQPFYVHRGDGATLAMAGLYEFWRDPAVPDPDDPGAWLTSFTILTTAAEPGLDRIHERQPLVLEQADWARWLDPAVVDPDAVEDLLTGPAAGRFAAYPVGSAVNTTANNGPGLLAPVDGAHLRGVVDPATGEILGT